jgi:hypothetical protein
MKAIISGKELRSIILRLEEDMPSVLFKVLVSRIFFRVKKTRKVKQYMRYLEEIYWGLWDDKCTDFRLASRSNYEIHPCEMKHNCKACGILLCSAEWCKEEEHNDNCETPFGWACSPECYYAVTGYEDGYAEAEQ